MASASAMSNDPTVDSNNDADEANAEEEEEEEDSDEEYAAPPPKKMMMGEAPPPEGSEEAAAEGKSMGACKPYLGALVAPSGGLDNNPSPPDAGLALEWAYGYRAFDSKSNLCTNTRGEVIYPVAGLVVVYNRAAHKQRHFLGHTDDVRCLASNPVDKDWMVSGQNATIENGRSTAPHVCVWNSLDFSQSFTLKLPEGARAVRSVAFSPDGRYVAVVQNDDNHMISIWDWRAARCITQTKGDNNAILQIKWNHTRSGPAYELVTVGQKHAYMWTFDGSALKGKRIALGGSFPIQSAWWSVTFSEAGHVCLGGSDGSILLCKAGAGAASKAIPVSKMPIGPKAPKVFTLDTYAGGIVAGLSDKTLVVFDSKLNIVKTFSFDHKVTSACVRGKDVLVGTHGAEIFDLKGLLDQESREVKGWFESLTQGHRDGELWGLALTTDGSKAYTAGEDNQLICWDIAAHKALKRSILNPKRGMAPKVKKASTTSSFPQNQCARAVALSRDGEHVAVGTNDGSLTVFAAATLEPIVRVDLNSTGQRKIIKQEGNWIQTIVYSPDGRTLAVGTHGSVIALLDVSAKYKVVGTITSHHSFLTHMDWSEDSSFLRSNDGAYELLFHSVDPPSKPKHITSASAMKDVDWASYNCVLSYATIGVVHESEGDFVNSVDRSPDGTLLATGNDDSRVALWRFPASEAGNTNHSYLGHSSHVTRAKFTPSGQHLLSTGGHDLGLLQWKVGPYCPNVDGQAPTHTVETW